ncbi:MAG: ABC transporter substrate-binding protein [Deferribacterales bacterium]
MVRLLTIIALSVCFATANADVTITDMIGRKVKLPAGKIERVIPLASSMSFISFLKAQNLVVGIEKTDKMNHAKRTYVYVNKPFTDKLPIIGEGGAARRPNIEAMVALKPDIIFTITADASEADMLQRKMRVPVVVLSYGYTGVELETVYKSLRLTAQILDRKERAEQLISYVEGLKKELSYRPKTPAKAYIGAVSYKGIRGIDSTEANFLPFRLAGIDNTVDAAGRKGHIFLEKEYVVMLNPPLVFIDSAGFATASQQAAKSPELYKRLSAFKTGRAYLIPANTFYYINIDLMLSNAFFMAKTAYPEAYANLDPEKKAGEIVKAFTGQNVFGVIKNDSGGFRRILLSPDGFKTEEIKW